MDNPTFSDGMAVLCLLGAVQGVFLAAVLASRHRNAVPNRLLAGLMLVFSLDLAMAVYHASAVSARVPALIGLDLPIALLYGPLLYLYVRTLTSERPALRRADLWHLVPFALVTLFLVPFFLRSGAENHGLTDLLLGAMQADTNLPAYVPHRLALGNFGLLRGKTTLHSGIPREVYALFDAQHCWHRQPVHLEATINLTAGRQGAFG